MFGKYSFFFGARFREEEAPAENPGTAGGADSGEAVATTEAEAGKTTEQQAAATQQTTQESTGDEAGKAEDKEKAALLAETMKRKKQIREQQEEIEKLKSSLSRWGDLDPEAVTQMVNQAKEAEQKELEKKGEFEKVKARMTEEHAKQIAALNQKLEESAGVVNKLQSQIQELTIGNSFASSSFIQDNLTLPSSKARTVYGSHFEINEEGRVVGYDKPKGAEGRSPIVNSSGDPKSFDEALADIINMDPDKESLIRSKVKPGAGSETKAQKPGTIAQARKLSGREAIAAGLKAGAIKPAEGPSPFAK